MSNAMMVISPYRAEGMWVFDEERFGLVKEPFVLGASEVIDALVAHAGLEGAETGFRLIFSAAPFPGHHFQVRYLRDELGGCWYALDDPPMEAWLCPALFHYFESTPETICLRAEAHVQ